MSKFNIMASLLAATLATASAADTSVSIALEIDDDDSVSTSTYTCDNGDDLSVMYINSGANALALMEIDDEDRIFVNVVAASGSKYASGAHIWWSKGDTATLENELSDGTMVTCEVRDPVSSE